ncbi:MAG: HAD family phosphatase [Prevotella sp.]|nr:HAD family phosphatase [Prevotella sp.]
MEGTIKNIVFDLGGVIITLDQSQAIRRFEELGVPDAAKRLDAYTQSGIFGELEAGAIDAETFRVELGRLAGREVTAAECAYAWQGYAKEVPQRNLDALLRLRSEGYRVALLSNTNPYMMEWVMSPAFDGCGHALTHYLDTFYLSYQLRVMKPDERIFRLMLDGEGFLPAETLFVDDGQRNVEAARRLGIRTFCPQNGEDWTNEIYNHLK